MTLGGAPNVKLATLFYEIETRTKGVDADLKKTEKSLGGLSTFIKQNPVLAFAGLATAATGAAALVLSSAVKLAAEFQGEMAKVNTVAKLSGEELQRMGEAIQAAFRELPVENTRQLTDALYQVISSGVSTADAMDVVRVATKAAIGGFTDAETAVDAITSVMNAYKDTNISAATAGDVLAKAVEVGKIEMDTLAGSIGNVVGIASVMGVSIQEVAAVTAQLSLNGVSAAEGITAIRGAINDIIRPTELFKKEFPELSANFNEARLKGDGLIKFMQDFIKESDGSSQAMKRLFNSTEGYKFAVVAAKDGGAAFSEMLDKMNNAAGSIDGQFNEVNKTATAQYQIIKNNLTSAFEALGQQVLPAVNSVLGALVTTLNAFNGAAAKARAKNDAAVMATAAADSFNGLSSAAIRARASMYEWVKKVEEGKVSIKDLDTNVLVALQARLTHLRDSSDTNAEQLGRIGTVLNQIVTETSARQIKAQEDEARARAATAKQTQDIEKSKAEDARKRAVEVGEAAEEAAGKEIKQADAVYKAVSSKMEELKKRRLELTAQLADAVVEATETMVDDMNLQLQRSIDALEELGATSEQVGQFKKLREGAIRAQENLEAVAKKMKQFADTRTDIALLETALMGVNNQMVNQIAIRNQPGISDAERVAAEKNIEQLARQRTELEDRVAKAKQAQLEAAGKEKEATQQSANAAAQRLAHAQNLANAIQVSAQGALRLAAGFGLVSQSTSKSLSDIITIAAQVPAIIGAVDKIVSATASGGAAGGPWGALANGLLSVGGVIADGIAQDKAARRERERVMNANTRAVSMLTKVQGDLLRLQVSGRDYTSSQNALQLFLSKFSTLGDFREFGKKYLEGVDPKRELEKLGLDFADIQEIAKTLGVTPDGQIGSYRRLLEAMKAADLSGFTSSFAGALEELDATLEINAEKFPNATSKLKALLELLADPTKGSAELFSSLKALDLSSPEGVTKALEEVQVLFDRLKAGDLTPSDLGNLSLADLKDIITRLNSELRGLVPPTGSGAGAGGPATDTTPSGAGTTPSPEVIRVTESLATQVERLIEATGLAAIEQLTSYVDGILSLNEALAAAGFSVPTSSANIAAPDVRSLQQEALAATGPANFSIVLNVTGDLIGDMSVLAERLTALMSPLIDQSLGRELSRATIVSGNRGVTVS